MLRYLINRRKSSLVYLIGIIERNNHAEKYMSILSSNQNLHISNNPTKSMESKVQRTLRKIKLKLSGQVCKKLYPTGSYPDKFCRITKIHKLSVNGGMNNLPIRATVPNLNTATYNLEKYLSTLSTLQQSGNTVKNTKKFTEDLKQQILS